MEKEHNESIGNSTGRERTLLQDAFHRKRIRVHAVAKKKKEPAKTRKYLKASRPSPRIGKRQFVFDRIKKKIRKKRGN